MISILSTKLSEVSIIVPKIYNDLRGKFYESWNQDIYKKKIKDYNFVQDNISHSKKNVLRGLHYQYPRYQQGKLVSVIKGKIFDVAVDIRRNSPTFSKWEGFILDDLKFFQLWIPPGFAHGFCVLSNTAIVQYKCTQKWSKDDEKTIKWNDPDININWPLKRPIISDKDAKASLLKEQKNLPEFKNG